MEMKATETSGLVHKPGQDLPHNLVNTGLILTAFGIYVLMVAFNGIAGSGVGIPDIFLSTVGDISDKFELFITPAGFAFSIWSIIYVWLALALIIFIVTIFLKNGQGRLYLSPTIASPAVTATLCVNFILNLSWIFVWDRASQTYSLLTVACIILFLTAITNILAAAFLAKNIGDNADQFVKGAPLFWWGVVYRIILNGLAMYTTWTVVASLINLTHALVYHGKVDDKDASLAALSLLVIIHCTWFVIENFVADKYARYVLTPYLVVIWAVNAIRANKMDDPDVPQEIKDFILSILIIASLTFVVRIALVSYKMVKRPLYQQH